MIVPAKVWRQMMYLCRKIGKDEWSGVMFYKSIGDITDLKNFKVIAKDIFLKDIGSSTYTEYESDDSDVDFLMENPTHMEFDRGKIHSHNNMAVFHSGTDWQDLWDNSVTHNHYLSFIVNNRGDVEVKMAWRSNDYKGTYYVRNSKGKLIKVNYEDTHPQGVLVVADGNITVKYDEPQPEKWFTQRYETLLEEEKKKPKRVYQTYGGQSSNGGTVSSNYGNGAPRWWEKNEEEKEGEKTTQKTTVNNSFTENKSYSPARFFSDLVSFGTQTSVDESISMVDGYSKAAFENWRDKFLDMNRWNGVFKKHFGTNAYEKEVSVIAVIRNFIGEYEKTAPEVYEVIDEMLTMVIQQNQYDYTDFMIGN